MILLTGSESMERLFNLDWQLVADSCLTIIAVVVLFFAFSYFLFDPVRKMLNDRKEKIQSELDDAKENMENAQALKAEYDEKLKNVEKEAEAILSRIPKGAWFCVLTPEGKLLSSEALADKLSEVKLSGKSSVCFLIGSSFGMADSIKAKADFKLSMSPMTFPHHLARVMVLEQIYRAEAIQAGSKYHK